MDRRVRLSEHGKAEIGKEQFYEISPDKWYRVFRECKNGDVQVANDGGFAQYLMPDYYEWDGDDDAHVDNDSEGDTSPQRLKFLLQWVYIAAVNGEPISPEIDQAVREALGSNNQDDLFAMEV